MRIPSTFGISKILTVAVAAMALGGGAYAFTASNTVSGNPAGMGESGAMSGYNATNVVWTPDATNPTNIQKVVFTLSTVQAGTVVYAGADNSSTIGWSSACSQGAVTAGSATETCTFAVEPPSTTLIKLAVSAAN
jgi:hypothetical protein